MPRMSVATIDHPEFINLQPLDINPLMSKCEIKVLYIGENRNRTYITKEVATEMSKTLRGAPIVGYYKQDKGDFVDHGDRVTIDSDGIKFESLTKPYGFVAPDAEVWFQKFEDTDDFGNKVIREYLMTTGYLWTGQYEEAKLAVEEGRPHSMEIDEKTLDGYWSENLKTGLEFFIINDAIFSKLCILGEDVEPCFEGSSVTAPEVSASFTLDDGFKQDLYTMMQELKFALRGGQSMEQNVENTSVVEEETPVAKNFSAEEDNVEKSINGENQISTEGQTSYAEADDKKKDDEEEEKKEDTSSEEEPAKDDEDDKKKYTLLQEQYNELQTQFTALQSDYQSLVDFKNQVEDEKKDALIAQFYMLSDEDKKDVIANKANYSLDDIEAKLSVICVRKKVSFDLDDTSKVEEHPSVTTYSLDSSAESSVPAWVSALRKTKDSRNI